MIPAWPCPSAGFPVRANQSLRTAATSASEVRTATRLRHPAGEGHVIAFAEDPNHRGYAEATELLFMNAVLLGPAY